MFIRPFLLIDSFYNVDYESETRFCRSAVVLELVGFEILHYLMDNYVNRNS